MDGHDGGGPGAEVSVARLDGVGAGREAAPVAQLGAEQSEGMEHIPADLDGIADRAETEPGFAAPVADFETGPVGEEPVHGPEQPATVLQLDVEQVASGREDVRVARLGSVTSRRGGARRPARPASEEPDQQRRKEGRRRTGRFGATRPAPDDRTIEEGTPAGEGQARSRRGRPELDPDADPVAVAREVCLQLLTERARTRQELAQALRRRGIPDEAADTVLERFDDVGLIDDAAFAGQWVRSRHTQRGLARRAIAFELRRKGVSDEDAGTALAEVDAESEERRARELVERKLRSLAVATADQRVVAARRLVGMLARKGYGASLAYRVVKEVLAEHSDVPGELGDAEPPDD